MLRIGIFLSWSSPSPMAATSNAPCSTLSHDQLADLEGWTTTVPTPPRPSIFAPQRPIQPTQEPRSTLPAPMAPKSTGQATPERMRAKLRDLIASVEAGEAGYDAVQLQARRMPPKRPTELTIGEINDWIARTPNQHHAIGRYQVIPKTLRRLTQTLGIPSDALFSAQLQDRLANQLMDEAGFNTFYQGLMTQEAFMHGLSKVWAGLPSASGRSYYHGIAGNRAALSYSQFHEQMQLVTHSARNQPPLRPAIPMRARTLPIRGNF